MKDNKQLREAVAKELNIMADEISETRYGGEYQASQCAELLRIASSDLMAGTERVGVISEPEFGYEWKEGDVFVDINVLETDDHDRTGDWTLCVEIASWEPYKGAELDLVMYSHNSIEYREA